MSTRAQMITKGRTLPPNARRVCSKALFAARGGARTPLRATETRALLRARYFFFFLAFSRGGDDEAKDKNFGKREEKRIFFFKRERTKGHGTLQKTSHTFLPRGAV